MGSVDTEVERHIAYLLVDAQALGTASSRHSAPSAEARFVLGLADVAQHTEFPEHVATGVDREDRDTCLDGALNGTAECGSVGDRDDQGIGTGGHSGVDQLGHQWHVEGVGSAVLELHPEISGGLVCGVLNDRPEGVGGGTVNDDHHADVFTCSLGEGRAE